MTDTELNRLIAEGVYEYRLVTKTHTSKDKTSCYQAWMYTRGAMLQRYCMTPEQAIEASCPRFCSDAGECMGVLLYTLESDKNLEVYVMAQTSTGFVCKLEWSLYDPKTEQIFEAVHSNPLRAIAECCWKYWEWKKTR